jgi:predicted amino acid dehydrogenase
MEVRMVMQLEIIRKLASEVGIHKVSIVRQLQPYVMLHTNLTLVRPMHPAPASRAHPVGGLMIFIVASATNPLPEPQSLQEAFEMIQQGVPKDIGDELTLVQKQGEGSTYIRGNLLMGMDEERMVERTVYMLSEMINCLPSFLRYM